MRETVRPVRKCGRAISTERSINTIEYPEYELKAYAFLHLRKHDSWGCRALKRLRTAAPHRRSSTIAIRCDEMRAIPFVFTQAIRRR
ncbi:hypothetical protein KM043_005025 [Ampulex compressa]|nr:hypothetical protein KM043_005025 [Ampulex compressa]